jgi:hypothetical protein
MKSKNKIELLNFAKRAERRRSRIKIALVTGILIIVAIIVGIGGVEAGYAISNTTTNSSDINVLTISGPTNITAKVGEPVKPTSSFECKTKTGVSVTDAVYTASNLPDGLRMDKDTGVIYGTPTTPGSGDYTIVVTSTEHPNAHLKIDRSFEVSPADPKLLTILNATYITGHVDTPIAETPRLLCTTDTDVDAENVTYTASNLPDGLEINKDTGIISGTPTTKGAGIYTIHATAHVNTIKLSADFPTYFSIDSPFPTSLEITDVSDITGNVGEFIAATPLYCETNTDMVVKDPQYSIDSNTPLPEGLEINVSNGVISGTPIASVTKICTVNVTSASYAGLFGSANINITIGAQVPKSIVISGAQDISGDVGTEVSNISGLSCATDTGTPIQDAVYTASNLPNGLEIDKDTGIIFGTPRTKQFGTYTINASAGDLVGTVSKAFSIDVKQSNPVTNAILDIQGMRDLAVPYRSTYKYECNGGTLSVDGDLPEGFTFSNNTITFSGSTPAEYGSFKLKATANDGSGKTNVITITYYPVEDIADGYCKFLYTDGRIADQALNVTADGTLYLTPTDCTNKILKAVYFNNNLGDVRTIGTNFLFDCHALTSVDLLPFTNVTSIGTNFLSYC